MAGLVSMKAIQVIVMSCRDLCFYNILAAQLIGTWKQKGFWNKTHYTFSPAQFPHHRLSISFIFSMPSMSTTFLVYCLSPRKAELTLSCVIKEQADLNVKLIHKYACTYIYFNCEAHISNVSKDFVIYVWKLIHKSFLYLQQPWQSLSKMSCLTELSMD